MNLAALTTPHKVMALLITLVLSVSISTHSHANNTRVDISRLHYTMGSTKLDITANVPTVYTLEGETEAVEL
ncbi:MAG: hypothetical protein JXR16_02085, partial [Bermanella sp.]